MKSYEYQKIGPASDYWGHWGVLGLMEPREKTPLAILHWAKQRDLPTPVSCYWAKPIFLDSQERRFLVSENGFYRFIRPEEVCDKPECPRDPKSMWMIHSHPEDVQVVAYAMTEAKVTFADGRIRKFRVTFVGEPLGRSGGNVDSRTGLRAHSHSSVIEEITQ